MADFSRKVKIILVKNQCHFVRYGKGDHEIWYSPITAQNLTVDSKITKRSSAIKTLKKAGINERV